VLEHNPPAESQPPAEQVYEQRPDLQVAEPVQAWAHAPQLELSVCSLTHAPLQAL
jgi:hypothetical protein